MIGSGSGCDCGVFSFFGCFCLDSDSDCVFSHDRSHPVRSCGLDAKTSPFADWSYDCEKGPGLGRDHDRTSVPFPDPDDLVRDSDRRLRSLGDDNHRRIDDDRGRGIDYPRSNLDDGRPDSDQLEAIQNHEDHAHDLLEVEEDRGPSVEERETTGLLELVDQNQEH